MECYNNRLKSFNKYHISQLKLRIDDLSKSGFYSIESKSDKVQCAFCSLVLRDWKSEDNCHSLHLEHSPNCSYARIVCGIEVDSLVWGDSVGGKNRLEYYDEEPTLQGRVPRSRPMIEARKQTYNGFSKYFSVSVHKLSLAGFHYSPSNDANDGCQCAYCNLSLDNWQKGDDPMEEHRNRSPHCTFFNAKAVKGKSPLLPLQQQQESKLDSKKPSTKRKGKSTSVQLTDDEDDSATNNSNNNDQITIPKRGTSRSTRSQSKQLDDLPSTATTTTQKANTRRTVSQKKTSSRPTSSNNNNENKKPLPPTPKEDNPTSNLSPLPELSTKNGIKASRTMLNQFKNKKLSRSNDVNESNENNEDDDSDFINGISKSDRSLTLAEFIKKCVNDESNRMLEIGNKQIEKFELNAKKGEDELRRKLYQTNI